MLFNTKFDLIVSLGEDCACSSYLRRFALQECSFPFDWLTNAALSMRIQLLENDFDIFLKKENLHMIPRPVVSDVHCDYYEDKKTTLYFYHDFPIGIDLEESFSSVKEKYNRRIQRLYKMVNTSKKVLFVWWTRNKKHTLEEIDVYYDRLKKKFDGTEIFMLILQNSLSKKIDYSDDNHIVFIRDKIASDISVTLGDEQLNTYYFEQIQKKLTCRKQLSYVFYKALRFLSCCIVGRNLRHKFRNYIKIRMLHAKL